VQVALRLEQPELLVPWGRLDNLPLHALFLVDTSSESHLASDLVLPEFNLALMISSVLLACACAGCAAAGAA
jgi:hypothetical protein